MPLVINNRDFAGESNGDVCQARTSWVAIVGCVWLDALAICPSSEDEPVAGVVSASALDQLTQECRPGVMLN